MTQRSEAPSMRRPVLAFRIQADRFGDLDHETKKVLDRTSANEPVSVVSDRLKSLAKSGPP